MRALPLLRRLLALGSLTVAVAACAKPSTVVVTGDSVAAPPDAITEENDSGSVAWSVAPDGKVVATVTPKGGPAAPKDVNGQITWKNALGTQTIPVVVDDKTGVVTAVGPKLDDDVTEIDYNLNVSGKPWTGVLQVPRGGTQALVDDAKLSATVTVPTGKVGPNGGVVQVVGNDRLEIVGDKGTGQTRVYVLDADLKPVDPGERHIKLAVGGDAPEVVVLAPDPGGVYFTGNLVTRVEPPRVTVLVGFHDEYHASIVGWSPGVHLMVGARAPHVHFLAASWGPPVVAVGVGAPVVGVAVGGPVVAVDVGAPVVAVGVGVNVGVGVGFRGPGVVVVHDDDEHFKFKGDHGNHGGHGDHGHHGKH